MIMMVKECFLTEKTLRPHIDISLLLSLGESSESRAFFMNPNSSICLVYIKKFHLNYNHILKFKIPLMF